MAGRHGVGSGVTLTSREVSHRRHTLVTWTNMRSFLSVSGAVRGSLCPWLRCWLLILRMCFAGRVIFCHEEVSHARVLWHLFLLLVHSIMKPANKHAIHLHLRNLLFTDLTYATFRSYSSNTFPGFINQLQTWSVGTSYSRQEWTYCGSTLRLNAFMTAIVSGPSSSNRQC